MDYCTSSKAPRRSGPDATESPIEPDECLILDPRGETQPRDIVEQRLQDLLRDAPLHSAEKKARRRRRSRAKPSALAPEKVGELIGTVISRPPPPSSVIQNQDKQSQESEK
jgi:hypothetical protein